MGDTIRERLSILFDDVFNYAVNGMWGPWGHLGKCIREKNTCKRTRRRECDNPSPQNGGSSCTGIEYQSVICRPNSCGNILHLV